MTYRSYKLTGDVLVDRAHWVEHGRRSDHPYMTDPDGVYRPAQQGMVEPLLFDLSDEQRVFMDSYTPVAQAQSKANIAALLRGLERI